MIRVSSLQKSYGSVRAVNGVSFEVEAGEVVGFLGPNGAGKSTTMRILCGYLAADGGSIEVAGQAVHPDGIKAKRCIGYLPESNPLWERMRVGDLLDFAGRTRGMERSVRRQALERVLWRCGLEGWAGRRIGTLSKGYRQRVGLGMALFSDPPVLVLDEPTNGLDPTEVTRMRALIRELGETKTILLSTHVLSEVQAICRRVVILSRGRVVADGSPLDLAAEDRAQLRIILRARKEQPDALGEEFLRVPGVVEVQPIGLDEEGLIGFRLRVNERHQTASRVSGLIHARAWALIELAHELPTLEQIFLQRTEATAALRTDSVAGTDEPERPCDDAAVEPEPLP